jgi:hypothetical protein
MGRMKHRLSIVTARERASHQQRASVPLSIILLIPSSDIELKRGNKYHIVGKVVEKKRYEYTRLH